MAEARSRGYFGIGVEGVSKSANVGALLRTAHAFGAAFCFIVGAGFDARAGRLADTADTPEHVPLWRFPDVEALELPQHCVLVGVELLDDATDLPSFRHPVNAAYVLGPERSGLSPAMLRRCRHVVRIPTRFALNLAVAGALVLYDRLLQHGRFAERPVGSRGAAASPSRCPPDTVRRAFVATSPTGWRDETRGHDPCRACRARSRAVSLAGMRLIVALLTLVLALPAGAHGAAEAGASPQSRSPSPRPEGTRQVRRLDRRDAPGIRPDHVLRLRPRAKHSVPALPGRGEVVLTVTERPSGRDTVAISAGFTYSARTPR